MRHRAAFPVPSTLCLLARARGYRRADAAATADRPVHRDLALLSAFFGLVSMSHFAVTKMFYFSAPLFLKSKYLAPFSPEQIDAT